MILRLKHWMNCVGYINTVEVSLSVDSIIFPMLIFCWPCTSTSVDVHALLFHIPLNFHSTITVTLRYEYFLMSYDLSLCSVEKKLDLFLLVTCFATAPCCVHMGSPSHIEGRGAAYLCYWFSHWLRSSFGKWKHVVCRKQDLELEMSACLKMW